MVNKHAIDIIADILVLGISFAISFNLLEEVSSYFEWVILSLKVALIFTGVSCLINVLFYPNFFMEFANKIRKNDYVLMMLAWVT